jgi:hypothetical protein
MAAKEICRVSMSHDGGGGGLMAYAVTARRILFFAKNCGGTTPRMSTALSVQSLVTLR